MNMNEAKKAGAAIGAEYETGMAAITGGLVSKLLPVMRELPPGKAVAMMSAFWDQFSKNAPVYGALKRVAVTRSESMRLAAGIDAGQAVATGSWNDLLKAAPKKTGGQGAGGGRKPRQPVADGAKHADPTNPADPANPANPAKPATAPEAAQAKPATPTAMIRQQHAAMLAVASAHRDRIAVALYNAILVVGAALDKIPPTE